MPFVPGMRRLSQLVIDTAKNWMGYRIDNLGSGDSADDALRKDEAILASLLTNRGDLVFRDAAGPARLAPGASGQFLKSQGPGADPVWAESPSSLVPLVSYYGTGANSHTRSWTGDYGFLRIMAVMNRLGSNIRPVIRFNGNSNNVYQSVYSWVSESSGPSRVSITSNNRGFIFPADIYDGHPGVLEGTLIHSPSPAGCNMFLWKSAENFVASDLYHQSGVVSYENGAYVNSITRFESSGAAFNLWLVVMGQPLPS
ncbi:MAG: hypothetical protein Q7R39_15325 [Dehalococcoidia bacterium]|nr:hypothetical protein [Dehalococcoidia bacterium]